MNTLDVQKNGSLQVLCFYFGCPEKLKICILLTNCCAFLFQLSKFTKCGDIYIIGDILRGDDFLMVPYCIDE